jgi:hypothetical protein
MDRHGTVTRRVTNLGGRAMYYSSAAHGFRRHSVRVSPAALRIPAGATETFTVTVTGPDRIAPVDDGYVVWRGANGTRLRIPVVLSR